MIGASEPFYGTITLLCNVMVAAKRKFCLLIKCACGCGEYLKDNAKDRHRNRGRFQNIEHFCRTRNWKGETHPSWKGGKTISHGYIQIFRPEHRRANGNYVAEQILVFEGFWGCCLLDWGLVHHLNHNRADNRIQNLLGITKWIHAELHMNERRDLKTGRMN